MKVEVKYFALLRQFAGRSDEVVDTQSKSPLSLYRELGEAHGFDLDPAVVKCAINGDFASMDAELSDGDEVVFIPPVAGG